MVAQDIRGMISFTEGLGLAVAVVSALFGYLAWRSSRKSVRLSEEQLRLAQEQYEMRPVLEVSEEKLLDFLDAVEDPLDVQLNYDALPDKMLRVTLINRGRTFADSIAGWLYFDPDYLEPDDRFGDGSTDEDLVEGLFRVQISGRGHYLLPNINDVLVFDVAVKVLSSGESRIKCEFAPMAGDSIKADLEVSL